ncbi:hypothetical protein B0A50_05841 [Salinomyces thailandicus]|uniref:DNA replication regulator Sld3 C-terminal domain-containing protein n=1 Tax=Salinomyces thailandicus TaxID=706561 RepID=A0A4U0TU56_9PEZI|nr:hypothetical protein B0A50_05841 [Salinomyces thailandica]
MSLLPHPSIQTYIPHAVDNIRQKRKRDKTGGSNVEFELDRRPFTIKPEASEPFAAPRVFAPVCLLPRARLSLSFLDVAQEGSRLFSAHLSVLETSHGAGEAQVLIAEEGKEKRLYAVERAGWRTYALCKLVGWVKSEELVRGTEVGEGGEEPWRKRRALERENGSGRTWWMRAAVPMPVATLSSGDAAGEALHLDMRPREAEGASCPVTADQVSQESESAVLPPDAIAVDSTPATASEVLQDLAKQYLEALYLSRTSLAYFSKGPLSRARAAFAGHPNSSGELQPQELITFLRDAILTVTVTDRKHRDSIPSHVKDLPPVGLETPEQPAKGKKRKQRKWKAKRDKYGFFSNEKDHIEKWWREHDEGNIATSSGETIDDALKRRLPRLRVRETYLQLILALEVLALEASLPPQHPPEPQQHDDTHDQEEAAATKTPKAKKAADLPALLNTLVDRLTIWHSLETVYPTKKSDETTSTADDPTSSSKSIDELRSFCIEVLLPFYIPRIPSHAMRVNKSLGGPNASSSVQRKSTSTRKPGEPATRPRPTADRMKARRPLERVASERATNDVASKRRNAPGLHRSATDSDALLASIKREASQTPGPDASTSISPAAKPQPQARKRSSLMHTLSHSRLPREIDIAGISKSTHTKAQRKAEMEGKLQEAISALRKPNRALAAREVAGQVDEGFRKATMGARPAGAARRRTVGIGPVAASLDQASEGEAVHVAATPSHQRSRALLSAPRAHQYYDEHLRAGAEPTSSFAVPQTGLRPRDSKTLFTAQGRNGPASTDPHHQLGDDSDDEEEEQGMPGIAETPSRGFAKFLPRGLARAPGTLDSPVAGSGRARRPGFGLVEASPTATRRLPVLPWPPPPPPLWAAEPQAVVAGTPVKATRGLRLELGEVGESGMLVEASPNVVRNGTFTAAAAAAAAAATRGPKTSGITTEAAGDAAGGVQEREGGIYDALGWDKEEEEYEELC